MKALRFFYLATAIALMTSCSGDGQTSDGKQTSGKEQVEEKGEQPLKPISESIQGPLGSYFQIVNKDYKLSEFGDVYIEFKRIKEGLPEPWKEGMTMGTNDGEYEPKFTIEFMDKDGNTTGKGNTSLYFGGKEEIEQIMKLGVNETGSIKFNADWNSRKAAQFKMYSDFGFHGELERTISFDGSIGKYPIIMTIHIGVDGSIEGAYYYKSKGPGNYLYVKGEKKNNEIVLNEFTKSGKQTGTYEGKIDDTDLYKGHFNTKSGNYEFVLNPIEMEPIDFSGVSFDDFVAEYITYENDTYSSSYGSGDSDDSDYDSFLDDFEELVDDYISFSDKALDGDLSAIAEAARILPKAQKIQSQIEKVKPNLSSSQISRLASISAKLAKAAAKTANKAASFDPSSISIPSF